MLHHLQIFLGNVFKYISLHFQAFVVVNLFLQTFFFFQIIYDDVLQLVKTLKNSLHKENIILKELVDKIYIKSAKLARHLSVSTLEMEPVTSQLHITQMVTDLHRGKSVLVT